MAKNLRIATDYLANLGAIGGDFRDIISSPILIGFAVSYSKKTDSDLRGSDICQMKGEMKRDYKAYFCEGRLGSAGFRLAVSVIIFIYSALFADSGMNHHPDVWLKLRRIIEATIFCFLPIFLLPVMIWGTRWQRIFAWLLAFIPLANWFVFLMARLGID